jgi:hypothetical protein
VDSNLPSFFLKSQLFLKSRTTQSGGGMHIATGRFVHEIPRPVIVVVIWIPRFASGFQKNHFSA